LVVRSAEFVVALKPRLFLMENVGELLEGKFTHHFDTLREMLERAGYSVHGDVHWLSRFGVPQMRRRALIVAVRRPLNLHTLEDLWDGYEVRKEAVTVRAAIGALPLVAAGSSHPDDPAHVSPSMTGVTLRRLQLIPRNGGSWPDLLRHHEGKQLLIPSMRRYSDIGKVGPHPDVYGRLPWDRPASTIKRECAHTGNGRYAHPDQDRLCTVRELAILQGFPRHYKFAAGSLSNMYRHVGDAVPPIVSFQIAHVAAWMLTGERPALRDAILADTHLRPVDIVKQSNQQVQLNLAEIA
jgi:DNA (cytosine-5)-methyltransferase 1